MPRTSNRASYITGVMLMCKVRERNPNFVRIFAYTCNTHTHTYSFFLSLCLFSLLSLCFSLLSLFLSLSASLSLLLSLPLCLSLSLSFSCMHTSWKEIADVLERSDGIDRFRVSKSIWNKAVIVDAYILNGDVNNNKSRPIDR